MIMAHATYVSMNKAAESLRRPLLFVRPRYNKLKEFVAVEVAISGKRAFEPVPPAFGFHSTSPEKNGNAQIAHSATAIVEPQVSKRIVRHALRQQAFKVVVKEWELELPAPARVPM